MYEYAPAIPIEYDTSGSITGIPADAARNLGSAALAPRLQPSTSEKLTQDADQGRRQQSAIRLARWVLNQDLAGRHRAFGIVASPPPITGRSRPTKLPSTRFGVATDNTPVLTPRALLTLVGRNYENLNTSDDTHYLSIGIIGTQLYAETTSWSNLTCDEEIAGYRAVMHELFGSRWHGDPELDNMRVIPLGALDRIGRFRQIRPTNRIIFGMPWVTIMHAISGPSAMHANVEIARGQDGSNDVIITHFLPDTLQR